MNLKQLLIILMLFLIRLVLTSHLEQSASHVEKEKRISELILIAIHTFAIGTNLFQSLDKCKSITPSYDRNKAKLKSLIEKLIDKRGKVNFMWGEAMTEARFTQRLNSSIQMLNIQLNEIDILMEDISNQQQYKRGILMEDESNQQQFKRNAVPFDASFWVHNDDLLERIRGALSKVVLSAKTVNAFVSNILYVKTCVEKANKLEKGLKNVEIAYEKMKGLETEAKSLLKYENLVYENVYSEAISPKIVLKLEKLNIVASKSPIFNRSIDNMSSGKNMSYLIHIANYLNNITAKQSPQNQRDKIIRKLISITLPVIKKAFICNKEILNAEDEIILRCSQGLDTFKSLYDKGKESIKTCHKSLFANLDTLQKQVKEKLSLQGKTIICLRNNNEKQKLVCMLRKNGESENSIVKKLNISSSDYNYYLSFCDKYIDIPGNGKVSICYKKSKMVHIQQVIIGFPSWNPIQIADTYEKCKVTKQMKVTICREKHNGINLDSIQKNFYVYPENEIKKVFMKCPLLKVIRKIDKRLICFYKKKKVKYHSKPMKIYRHRYKESVLIDYWTICHYKNVTLPSQKEKICNDKSNEMEIYEVLNLYKNWFPNQVTEVYKKCGLNNKQITEICKLKETLTELEIIKKFYLYDRSHVISYYNKCQYFSLTEKYRFCIAIKYRNFEPLVRAMKTIYFIDNDAIESLCESVLSTCANTYGDVWCRVNAQYVNHPEMESPRNLRDNTLSKNTSMTKNNVIKKREEENTKFPRFLHLRKLNIISRCYKRAICQDHSSCNDRYETKYCYQNAHQCYIPGKYRFMKRNCYKTCHCERIKVKDCVDAYGGGGYCYHNKRYCSYNPMPLKCYKTCICDPREKSRREFLQLKNRVERIERIF